MADHHPGGGNQVPGVNHVGDQEPGVNHEGGQVPGVNHEGDQSGVNQEEEHPHEVEARGQQQQGNQEFDGYKQYSCFLPNWCVNHSKLYL